LNKLIIVMAIVGFLFVGATYLFGKQPITVDFLGYKSAIATWIFALVLIVSSFFLYWRSSLRDTYVFCIQEGKSEFSSIGLSLLTILPLWVITVFILLSKNLDLDEPYKLLTFVALAIPLIAIRIITDTKIGKLKSDRMNKYS